MANPGVAAWAADLLASSLFISDITLLELELGVLLKELQAPQPARGISFATRFGG